MKTKYIQIVNFHKYQHYSDRNIHWVKLYLDMLTDYKIRQLSATSKWIFVGVILLTATKRGQCEYDLDYIKEMLGGQGMRKDRLRLALDELSRLALIKIVSSLEKRREEKIRKEKRNDLNKQKTNLANKLSYKG